MSGLARRALSPSLNAGALLEVARFMGRHRELILTMAGREVRNRYVGSALGSAWAVLSPLLLMGVYVFAFAVIFRARLGEAEGSAAFVAYVLAALGPWVALQDAVARSTQAVVGNANLVKQIVFPSEVLPIKTVFGAAPTLAIGLLVAVGATLAAGHGSLFGLLVLLPAALVFFTALLVGIALLLAAVGVMLRDLKDVVALLLTVGLFLHPILYAPAATPQWLEAAFHASPFSYPLWCLRDALFHGAITRPLAWVAAPLIGALALALGWRVFRTLKPMFGNAL